MRKMSNKAILIYDNKCTFCNYCVSLLVKIDKKNILQLIPINIAIEDVKLNSFFKDYLKIDSMLIYHNSKVIIKSEAVLTIANLIGFPYNIFSLFTLLPHSFLDYCYDIIATNRYKLFSHAQCCKL
jgi:predicted DCC family thiol-disulfide oxidoreductase YuxK